MVERLGSGKYRLEGGEVVGGGEVEGKIKTGKYGYVALGDDDWRRTYNWASTLEFKKDSCRYQRNEDFKEKDWIVTVRCAYGSYNWDATAGNNHRNFVDLKLTKDNYVLLN